VANVDVVARGKDTDLLTAYLLGAISATPGVVVLTGMHYDTLGVRALRTDIGGRLFVNVGTSYFNVVNMTLTDNYQYIITGAPIFRRLTFYVFNANANINFQLADQTQTVDITIVPNVPLTIDGIFISANAKNANPGIVASLQAIVGYDPSQQA
jgi:hypothetical protein